MTLAELRLVCGAWTGPAHDAPDRICGDIRRADGVDVLWDGTRARLLACDFAQRVLPQLEEHFPAQLPLAAQVVGTARDYAMGRITRVICDEAGAEAREARRRLRSGANDDTDGRVHAAIATLAAVAGCCSLSTLDPKLAFRRAELAGGVPVDDGLDHELVAAADAAWYVGSHASLAVRIAAHTDEVDSASLLNVLGAVVGLGQFHEIALRRMAEEQRWQGTRLAEILTGAAYGEIDVPTPAPEARQATALAAIDAGQNVQIKTILGEVSWELAPGELFGDAELVGFPSTWDSRRSRHYLADCFEEWVRRDPALVEDVEVFARMVTAARTIADGDAVEDCDALRRALRKVWVGPPIHRLAMKQLLSDEEFRPMLRNLWDDADAELKRWMARQLVVRLSP